MGLFDKFKSKGPEYAALDQASPAAQSLNNLKHPLESFAAQVSDPMEIVPSGDTAFVFVGKPPKAFGLVWIQDGQLYNLKKVVAEKGIPATTFTLISDDLRGAYERSGSASRYSTSLGGKNVVVTPSETLAREVNQIIQKLGA
ncbi:MAG: hypothetical protein MUF69_09510 [Desulfobacterota bacterium]|jgi:hypothetical protein|nr:hypothetical protein [Thermodesulfobacteriota bacterium]